MLVHLETDFGGDPDDACALAMLLGWPGVEFVGITTCLDAAGNRAAYVHHVLALAGRQEIPVAAGPAASLTTDNMADPVIGDPRHWPLGLVPRPSSPGAALDLLDVGIARGATVVSIGPLTNLALLEARNGGTLGRAAVVMMGGWVDPAGMGLPAWGPEMDFNVQFDTAAAESVFAAAGSLTMVGLPSTMSAHLRAVHLPRLRLAGSVGRLLADQSEAHGVDAGMTELGRSHSGLPVDLLNVHYDPVACAVAVGWDGAVIEETRLVPTSGDGVLRFARSRNGRSTRLVTSVDGEAFSRVWLSAVEAIWG